MVGVGGCLKILTVAVDTIIPDPVELQPGCSGVTLFTTHRLVYPCQWKAVLLMKVRNVVNQPIGRRMAAGAIVAHGLLVHILVARYTIGWRF